MKCSFLFITIGFLFFMGAIFSQEDNKDQDSFSLSSSSSSSSSFSPLQSLEEAKKFWRGILSLKAQESETDIGQQMVVLIPSGSFIPKGAFAIPLSEIWRIQNKSLSRAFLEGAQAKIVDFEQDLQLKHNLDVEIEISQFRTVVNMKQCGVFHGYGPEQCCGIIGRTRQELLKIKKTHGEGKCLPCPKSAMRHSEPSEEFDSQWEEFNYGQNCGNTVKK